MRKLWKGLLISGLAWAVIGLAVMTGRSRRQKASVARRARRNLVKVAKVSLPLVRGVKSGQTYLPRLRRKG